MKDQKALKSIKAMYHDFVTFAVFTLIGIYSVIAFDETNHQLVIVGYVFIAIAIIYLILNIPVVLSSSILIELDDEKLYLNKMFHKKQIINLNDITSIKAIMTLRKYLRPLNHSYYNYGMLLIKTKVKCYYVFDVDNIKEVEKDLNHLIST